MADYVPRLKTKYDDEIHPALMKHFEYSSSMQVPELQKISLNMGVGDAVQDNKLLEKAVEDLTIIAGQKPAITAAKKSISNFKLRDGVKIGCRTTLRRS